MTSCNLAKYKFLKLPKDDTEVSKQVGVNIIQRENILIYICALVLCNKTNVKMLGTCIDIIKVCNISYIKGKGNHVTGPGGPIG